MRQEPHAGAPVVHGSERPELTENAPSGQPTLHPEPLNELPARIEIYRAADVAGWRIGECRSLDAGEVLHRAWRVAGAWTFKRASAEELETVLEVLQHLFTAADGLESLEGARG